MFTGYGTERRRVAMLGSEARRFVPLALELIDRGLSVTMVNGPEDLTAAPVTCVIIAERFHPGMDWPQWWARAAGASAVMTQLLPHMATPSTALLLAYSRSSDPAERGDVRAAMDYVVGGLETEAATFNGIDFTANAVEIPPSSDHKLLEIRLRHFVSRRTSVDSGIVLPVEVLYEQSVTQALSSVIL